MLSCEPACVSLWCLVACETRVAVSHNSRAGWGPAARKCVLPTVRPCTKSPCLVSGPRCVECLHLSIHLMIPSGGPSAVCAGERVRCCTCSARQKRSFTTEVCRERCKRPQALRRPAEFSRGCADPACLSTSAPRVTAFPERGSGQNIVLDERSALVQLKKCEMGRAANNCNIFGQSHLFYTSVTRQLGG